jgi:hypothetical protein
MSGCRSTPKRSWVDPIHLDNWPRELREHPMPPDENMHKIDLGGTENASHHLVRVRDREPSTQALYSLRHHQGVE